MVTINDEQRTHFTCKLEIRELERSVVEVNAVFQDLATMVQEQGSLIDHIESNIQMVLVVCLIVCVIGTFDANWCTTDVMKTV